MTTAPLFDDRVREDDAYMRANETMYQFLDRVSRPELATARGPLSDWFERWPADDREGLRSRLMSKDQANFMGAFWELYLHELHLRLGFTIERDPDLPGVRTHPDFLMRREDTSFYMEATVIGLPDPVVARRQREEVVIEAINKAYNPDFALRLYRLAVGADLPPTRAIVSAIENWMSALDWETERNNLSGPQPEPSHIEVRGTHLWVRPWPRAPDFRGDPDFRTVATRSGGGGVINEPPAILDDLKDKASRFGKPQAPFVIAVLCNRDFTTDLDIEQALFGPEVVRVPVGPEAKISDARLDRDPRGFWQHGTGQRATRVSAVLSAIHLGPWSFGQTPLRLWRNPWATWPLPDCLPWATTDVDLSTGQPVHREATTEAASVLGQEGA